MSCGKRLLEGQDPDYENSDTHDVKRIRLLEESAKADLTQKVLSIIQREFSRELAEKEREVFDIQERLHHAQKALHLLRYAVVKGYYTLKQLQGPSESDQTQKHIHPALKKLIGKQPRHTLWQSLDQRSSKYRQAANDNYSKIASDDLSLFENSNDACQNQVDDGAAKVTKVPRYIPPTPSGHKIETQIGLSRNFRHKIKQRIILGNISKWIPIDSREDEASHKWMVYVRGPQESPDISQFVSKIRFFLHPSYKPHDVVEVTSHPFHLCRRGWGEFPVRIQVHFTHQLNKPVDLIHHLKLDRSYTGLQRLGAETVVDVWLHMGSSHLDTSSPLFEKSHPGEMIDTASPLFEKSHPGEMIDTASPLFEKSHPGEMIDTASPLFEKSRPGEMIDTASPFFEKSRPGEMIDTASPFFEKNRPGEMIDTASPLFEKSHPGEMINTASPLFEKSRPGEMTECCQDNSQQEAIQTDTPSTASETVNIKLEMDCVDDSSETNNCFTSELHIKQELDQDLDTLRSEMIIHKISPSVTSFDHDYFQFANKQSRKENGKSIENSSWSNNACQNESLEYDPFVKHKNNCLGQTSLESSKSEMLNVSKNLCFHNENNIKNKSVESGRSFSCHSVHDFRNNVFNGFTTEEVIKKELDDDNSSDICTELSGDALKDPLLPSTKVALPLKKPTTLVKCMDASGNIFFIALGRLNAPSLKPINYLETKCESVGVPSFSRITTPTTVSSSDTIRPSLVFGEHGDCLENTDLVQTRLSLGLDSLMLLVKNNSLISKTQSSSMKTALNDLSSRPATTTTTPLLSSSSCESDKSLLSGRDSVTSSSSVGEPAAVHSKQKTVVFLKDRQYYIVKPPTLAVNSSLNKPQASNTVDCARNINPILNTATIKLEPDLNISCGVKTFGKSILNTPYGSINSATKPCYSLLKKQTKNIPLTTPSLVPVVKTKPVEEGESGFLLKRRPDASNKKMLGINQTHSAMLVSRCFEYEEKVSQAVSMCKFPNQAMCVRWLLRHLPLVSRQASDLDYKSVHPFCASSATNFIQWNVGKQRAAEWLRAKAVSRLLRQVGYTEETAWSTRAIMVWSRLHGYTPMAVNSDECKTDVEPWSCSYSEPVRALEWLESSHNMDLGADLEVDVIQVPSPNTTSLRDNFPESNQPHILNSIDVETGLESQLLFVRESARELGFRFNADQLSPGMMYSTAERLILEAVKSLADDILRRALSKAWERNSNRPPDAVGVADIGAALQDRVEFDLLTNAGLACQSTNTG